MFEELRREFNVKRCLECRRLRGDAHIRRHRGCRCGSAKVTEPRTLSLMERLGILFGVIR